MPDFEEEHMDWIKKVTQSHFEKKRHKTLEMFLEEWLYPAFPIDEVGIMLLARFFHGHIAIFVNEKWWSTRADKDLAKVNVFLVYRGNKVFDDTRMMTTAEYSLVRNDVRKYKLKVERDIKKMEAAEKAKEKKALQKKAKATSTHTMKTRRSKKLSSSSEDSDNESLDLEKVMDEGVLHNTDIDHTEDIMHKPTDESPNPSQDNLSLQQSSEPSADEMKDTHTERSDEINQKDTAVEMKESSTQDTENSDNIMQKANENVSEPAAAHVEHIMQKEEDNQTGSEPTGTKEENIMQTENETGTKDAGSDEAHSDENITLAAMLEQDRKMEEEEAKKKQKQKPKGKKSVVKPSRRSARLNKDKSTKRDKAQKKKTTFACDTCDKEFQTKNGLYKHEMMHTGLKYFCGICEKGFLWQCELDDHERRHTDKRSERIKCRKPNCKKDYSSRRALQRHVRDDHGQQSEITCNFKDNEGILCSKKSKTLTLHKQHYTHEHEGGFLTLCGVRVPWPNDRQKHHRECRKCLRIKDKHSA